MPADNIHKQRLQALFRQYSVSSARVRISTYLRMTPASFNIPYDGLTISHENPLSLRQTTIFTYQYTDAPPLCSIFLGGVVVQPPDRGKELYKELQALILDTLLPDSWKLHLDLFPLLCLKNQFGETISVSSGRRIWSGTLPADRTTVGIWYNRRPQLQVAAPVLNPTMEISISPLSVAPLSIGLASNCDANFHPDQDFSQEEVS